MNENELMWKLWSRSLALISGLIQQHWSAAAAYLVKDGQMIEILET